MKTIVITGGSQGIGKAIATLFKSNDFKVITCSRSKEKLNSLVEELNEIENGEVFVLPADLSIRDDVNKFIDFITEKTEKVDVLVNNTGVFIPGQINQEEEGLLEKTIETNVYSAYHVTRGVIKSMMELKSGSIFNICSTASIMPYVNGGSYCISKYALMGMTKVLREEMKEFNVKVTAVLPGATKTASWEGVDLPEERFIKPEDIAESILGAYNLSDRTVVEELLIRPQLGDL